MTLKSVISLLATLLILLVAVFIGRTLWVNYMDTPDSATVACAPT